MDELLPPGVSPVAAAAALFVGKAVRVLRAPLPGGASQQALHAAAEVLALAPALRALCRREELQATKQGGSASSGATSFSVVGSSVAAWDANRLQGLRDECATWKGRSESLMAGA